MSETLDLKYYLREIASAQTTERVIQLSDHVEKMFAVKNEQLVAIQTQLEKLEVLNCYFDKAETDVLNERQRQDSKWGEQNHDPFTYLTILIEEVGEFAQAALHMKYGGHAGGWDHLREEAVQMAAVSLAIVQCLDRNKWRWPAVYEPPQKEES